jgi:FKBP-type peptidyl-prolyl cis-trans isomerase 2
MIRAGSKVAIHYTLSVDGRQIDDSKTRGPLTYVQGAGQIVKGLEVHLEGLQAGDVTEVEVPPEEAYGVRNEEAVQVLPLDAFENSDGLRVGSMIEGTTAEGEKFSARVQELDENKVTLDLNHPLAGKALAFKVEILEVSEEEVE